MLSGCFPAVSIINANGGVMGKHLTCTAVDTRGDPADAVPAAEKLVATNSNLVGILGPSSNEAASTVPIFNTAHIPMFPDSGQAEFDHTADAYFWRLVPPDAADGTAMAAWAIRHGYTRAAAVFSTGSASSGNASTAISGFTKLGGHIVANISITSDQASYQTEIAQLVNSHPQVILYAAGARTSATFFSELKQLHAVPPVIGTEIMLEPSWLAAVTGVLGASTLASNFTAVEQYVPTGGPGWNQFHRALLASKAKLVDPAQYSNDPFTYSDYDGVNLLALAMLEAKSTNPQVFNRYIGLIAAGGPGAAVVHTFAEGKAAIAAGHHVRYIGLGGAIGFNRYHNSTGVFSAVTVAQGPKTLGLLTSREMARAEP